MRKGLAAAGVVALISAGSAACGADKTTPQGRVGDAFDKLGKQTTVSLDLGFGGTSDQIYTALKDEDGFTQADAKLLASLHLTLAASSTKSFSALGKDQSAAAKDGAFDIGLTSEDGGQLAEIRAVDQKAYIKFDIKGLEKLDTSPNDTKDLAEFNQFVDNADQLPANLASVKAAIKGQWVSIDPKAFTDFAKSLGGNGGSDSSGLPTSTPSFSTQEQKQIVDGLRQALTANVTYKELGSKDGADHVQVSVPARQFVKDAATSLTPVFNKIPGFPPSDLTDLQNAKDVPNKTISADVAIKNGNVSSVTVDLAQFDDTAAGPLPLTLGFQGSAAAIKAPAGAQVLNPQDIIGLVMNVQGGSGDDSSF
ncbi:hypothetical protein SAMN05216259_10948 [Actinacidiphila guanduensis]|uniref:Lipoprotein n=2 Tax=Actinacidiphila guanduensis TaxID=310781 RepID=A0A1H0IN25_9ACTN|nr:hypothetical protein SAMN05216259_10948 [Actinacidiphila guanduensis]